MANDLLPAKPPDGLTRIERAIAYRMVEGLPRPLDDGDGSAAIRTVRLKACQFIEGKPDGASVVVNVSQTSNNVVAGYVIRLPARSSVTDLPAIEQEREPLTIEGSR
jgi:hypothetical protein